MSGLSSGAVANALAAGRNYQDVARANKQQVIGAVNSAATDLTGAMKERQSRQKVEQYLVSSGMTPEQARSVAMLPAREMGLAISDHLGQKARQQTQEFATSQQDRSFAHDMTMDEALGKRQAADDARRQAATAEGRTYAEGLADKESAAWTQGIAPIQEQKSFNINPSVPPATWPVKRDPSPTEALGQYGAAGGRNMPDFASAFDRMRKPPANPMADIESDIEKERRLKAEGLGRYTPETPKPVEQKPWQPMTEQEQLDFAKKKAEATRGPGSTPAPVDSLKSLRLRVKDPNDLAQWDALVREQSTGLGGDPVAWANFIAAMDKKYPDAPASPVKPGMSWQEFNAK